MSGYVLGLDLGPNSIGWAMIEADESGEPGPGFYDTGSAGHPPVGVRIFEAGLHNFDTAKEASMNQARRTARSMRRNHARRNARKRAVMNVLSEIELMPTDRQDRALLFGTDPYELRSRALDERLDPHELGRAIYHLAQRRGFRSNRKSGQSKEDEGILKEIGELATAMDESGARTLGEYLFRVQEADQGPDRPRLRARHTRRDMYQSEFRSIIEAQRPHHPDILTDDNVTRIEHFLFYQHPFELTEDRRSRAPSRANLHRAPSVRPCPLERGALCCPRGEWIAQRFRILKEVNNLRVAEHHGQERDLHPDEREAVLRELGGKDRVKFDDLRKLLAKMGRDPQATFNLERGERKALNGNVVEHKLAVAFGRRTWADLDESVRELLREAVLHEENAEALTHLLLTQGADSKKAAKLIHWNPPDGYLGYSRLAIERLVPLLEDGLGEYEAIEQAYPDRPTARSMDRLPVLDSRDLPLELQQITNPVVRRTLVELRKVINMLVREHGKPTRIVVELAREMKQGTSARKQFNHDRALREKARRTASERVAEYGGNPYSRNDVNRWMIWEEQGKACLYTGKPIPPTELFSGGEWEIDHILPRWQSLDDSLMNKVLVQRIANEQKGDRTPAQWLGEGSEAYKQLISRAKKRLYDSTHKLPYPKFKRLLQREVEPDQFAGRQLKDTQYIATAVVRYLQSLYPPELRVGEKAVRSCRGGLTHELRYQWGLNNILDDIRDKDGLPLTTKNRDGRNVKNRADHRHHAIDAVVAAVSTRAILKRFQDFWKSSASWDESPTFPLPWEMFREDIKRHGNEIVVSHRVDRKLRGALHEETFYGAARGADGHAKPGVFVTRKPLSDLTGKAVRAIRDDVVRELVERRLADAGWDGRSNTLPKDWHADDLRMKSGVPIRKVRIEVPIKEPIDLGHRFAISGNNHHLEIIDYPPRPGRDIGEKRAVVVPMMEAAGRARPPRGGSPRPIVQRDFEDGGRLLMHLNRKDTVRVDREGREPVYCVVQKMAGSATPSTGMDLYLRDVRDSRPASEGNKSPFLRLKSFRHWAEFKIRKMAVDPIGRVAPGG